MNYRDLLMRYIAHVQKCEGVDYVDETEFPDRGRPHFAANEIGELKVLSEEATEYWNGPAQEFCYGNKDHPLRHIVLEMEDE